MTDSTIPGAPKDEKRLIGWMITGSAAIGIVWLTLVRGAEGAPPPSTGVTLLTDVVLNLVLFIPLGVGLALMGKDTRLVAIIGTLASAAIECIQYFWLPGRDGSLHDVVTNGAGALLGAILVYAWGSRLRWWHVGGPCLAAGLASIWVAGATQVHPAIPVAEWYGFHAHQLGTAVQFPGEILEFVVNGDSVPDGRILDQAAFQRRLTRSDTLYATTRIILPPPYPGLAQLVGIMSPSGEELINLWQDKGDLLARVRLRASGIRLRIPWFALKDGLTGNPGDTLGIEVMVTGKRIALRVSGKRAERSAEVSLAPELFWASFVPWDYPVGTRPPGWPLLAVILVFGAIGLGTARIPVIGMGVTLLALWAPAGLLGTGASGGLTLGFAGFALLVGQLLGRRLGFVRG